MSQDQLSLADLFALIKDKISRKEKGSYSYELVKDGSDRVVRKVGEEALEVVIATFINERNPSEKSHHELVGEICDLFYHTLVLSAAQGVDFSEISAELSRRNKLKK